MESSLREYLSVEFDSTLPRFDVLAVLERYRDGLRMSELSKYLMVSNGNVTGVVERLVQSGLVERLPVEGDKRATHVRLTPLGLSTFQTMAAEHEQWINELMQPLNEEEVTTMIQYLSRIPGEMS